MNTEEQKARLERFDDGASLNDHDTLQDACAQFLNTILPGKNVINEVTAKKFLPLFNREMFSKLSKDEATALAEEYQYRFSMYHPIKIISSGEYDNSPAGVFYPVDEKHHKLIAELPPVFRSVTEVGQLGGNASDLMVMFMNTTRNATPVNDRTNIVKDAIIEAIRRVNAPAHTDDAQRAYADQVNAIEQKKDNVASAHEESSTDGMEWE